MEGSPTGKIICNTHTCTSTATRTGIAFSFGGNDADVALELSVSKEGAHFKAVAQVWVVHHILMYIVTYT
jgi:hypothetical protein